MISMRSSDMGVMFNQVVTWYGSPLVAAYLIEQERAARSRQKHL